MYYVRSRSGGSTTRGVLGLRYLKSYDCASGCEIIFTIKLIFICVAGIPINRGKVLLIIYYLFMNIINTQENSTLLIVTK